MDRSKMSSSNRTHKKVTSLIGNEFFALGTKGPREDKTKTTQCSKNTTTTLDRDRKREATSSISNINKKPKLCLLRSSNEELWEQIATECDVVDLLHKLFNATDQNDNDAVNKFLCGGVKSLMASSSKTKPDSVLCMSLLYISKTFPDIFCSEIVTSGLLRILRRDYNVKNRQNIYSHVIAATLLARAYSAKQHWPEHFLRIYSEDAINERSWVDNEICASFVELICTTFQTRVPNQILYHLDSGIQGSGIQSSFSRDVLLVNEDDSGDNSISCFESNIATCNEFLINSAKSENYRNRFPDWDSAVEKYVINSIKEQLNKRQQQDCYTRNLIKFLCTVCGLPEVRYLCMSRLELWIHNGKLVKFAQQLLAYICFNVKYKYSKDHEVLAVLVKMRLKTKPLINFFMTCLKEMIILQPDILRVVLKLVVQNELSTTRNPNNMGMLATMFQTSPDQSPTYLAEIYKEFLLQRDDCLRTLRVFLRELVRILRFDMNIVKFCKNFLNDAEFVKLIENSEFKERIFQSMVDIICLCMLLSISPQIRETCITIRNNRDVKSSSVLEKFYTQMSEIQLDAVSWMFETVPNLFKISAADYNQALHKILLLENPEQYSRFDQWPSEPERATLLRMASETPIHQDTLLRIILIGITKDIPLSIPECIDILILVIKRASSMRSINIPAVHANKLDIIDFLFSMAEYHYPENIKLPSNYEPPKLAITILYWKAWLILIMISAHNASTFGAFCWEHYPTMKMLIEMCITNQFNENASKEELQIVQIERDQILEFESYLAAQTSQAVITEENAILITQLMLMDPMGQSRRIPISVLEQLKYLNKSLKLGHLLCRSRKPDLLLDIIQRQGTTLSMPWLSDLVQNSEGEFNHLPVQCLCEFLLFNAKNINEDNSRDAELVNYLRNLIMQPSSNKQSVCEVLDYIFRRLSSTVKQSRLSAVRGLKIIFKCSEYQENEWLMRSIPRIPYFNDVCAFIIPQLRSACQVENSPILVMSYIQFIAAYTLNDSVTEMLDHIIDMAQLIVERNTMFQHIISVTEEVNELLHENRLQTLKCLFVMFNNYIIKLQEHNDTYEWTEYPDLLMVQFSDGVQLPLHLNIIHAFIILLTQSSNTISESIPILDYWFPTGHVAPIGYMTNLMQEPVQLLPDWLKLKMIRSSVDRLIEAALDELTPDQIVLFVQNFGTPVNSMSKLLALLDHAVIEQIDEVKRAILNKAYLAQLIEIQQSRGAKNGHFTVQALDLHSHSQTVPDPLKISHNELCSIDLTQLKTVTQVCSNVSSVPTNQEVENAIESIFKCTHLDFYNNDMFRKLIHRLLQRYKSSMYSINADYTPKKFIEYIVKFIKTLSNGSKKKIANNKHICTFFRTLMTSYNNIKNETDLIFELVQKSKEIFKKPNLMQVSLDRSRFSLCLNNILRIKYTQQNVMISKCAYNEKREIMKALLYESDMKFEKEMMDYVLYENNFDIKSLSKFGLFVDYMLEIDPELSILCFRNLQVNKLFSETYSNHRFYLLSLICHQTNWETLVSTLEYLLKSKGNFDCYTLLNFIDALINNPKLWQGRDKTVPRNISQEAIFTLTKNEMTVFTQLILKEADIDTTRNTESCDYNVCNRVDLLLRLTHRNSNDLVVFIDCVCQSNCSHSTKLKVLQQIYLMYPSIKFIRYIQPEKCTLKLQTLKGCSADKISNYLITCLGNLLLKKDFELLSTDIELLIRKLAASHPTLFLRQLGVLSSLVQGKSQISMRMFRDENHCQRFIQILRTFELLQPMLYDDVYKHEFQATLNSYFTFFKQHSSIKETYHILMKFVEILHSYVTINPSSALIYIEQHIDILMGLSKKSSSSVLQQLVQCISLFQCKSQPARNILLTEMKSDIDFDESSELKPTNNTNILNELDVFEFSSNISIPFEISNKGISSIGISGSNNKTSVVSPYFLNLVKLIKHTNAEDAILGPLQEIESFTSKRFSFMSELFDRLLELIFSSSAQIRSNAFILLIRHLKHNPGRSDLNKCTLNAYIQCLRDENSSVAATAIDNLAEMTVLLQEHAIEILSVVFSLGMKSRLNTSMQIKRVLQTLMLQHGY